RIHPGIGIARVGDSLEEYTIGPEVIGAVRETDSRDDGGALKRQAARFRIYGVDEAGSVVRGLADDDAEITGTVHIANRNAAWYRFIAAADRPEAVNTQCALRNPTVAGADRGSLVIDPGPKSITGRAQPGVVLDGGAFKNIPVSLGELRTDDLGRLLVL